MRWRIEAVDASELRFVPIARVRVRVRVRAKARSGGGISCNFDLQSIMEIIAVEIPPLLVIPIRDFLIVFILISTIIILHILEILVGGGGGGDNGGEGRCGGGDRNGGSGGGGFSDLHGLHLRKVNPGGGEPVVGDGFSAVEFSTVALAELLHLVAALDGGLGEGGVGAAVVDVVGDVLPVGGAEVAFPERKPLVAVCINESGGLLWRPARRREAAGGGGGGESD